MIFAKSWTNLFAGTIGADVDVTGEAGVPASISISININLYFCLKLDDL